MNVDYMGMEPKGKQSDEEEEKQRRIKRVGLTRSGVGEDKVLENNLKEVGERANNTPAKPKKFDEPNRRQAISWNKAKSIIEKGKFNLQGLRYTSGDATGKQVGPFGGESGGRYIFTEKYGWIDLGHFFQVAAGVQNSNGVKRAFLKYFDVGGAGISMLWGKTKEVENAQVEPSIWSYEDAPSNYAGYIYSVFFYDNDKNLTETLDDFFKNAGAKNPDDAPNWDQVQQGPLNYRKFQQNKSLTPVLCPNLNTGCENDGTNSYDDGNK